MILSNNSKHALASEPTKLGTQMHLMKTTGITNQQLAAEEFENKQISFSHVQSYKGFAKNGFLNNVAPTTLIPNRSKRVYETSDTEESEHSANQVVSQASKSRRKIVYLTPEKVQSKPEREISPELDHDAHFVTISSSQQVNS